MDEGAVYLIALGDLLDLCFGLWIVFFGQHWKDQF